MDGGFEGCNVSRFINFVTQDAVIEPRGYLSVNADAAFNDIDAKTRRTRTTVMLSLTRVV